MFLITEIFWQPWLKIYQANNKYRQLDYAIEQEKEYKRKKALEEEEEDDDEEEDEKESNNDDEE